MLEMIGGVTKYAMTRSYSPNSERLLGDNPTGFLEKNM